MYIEIRIKKKLKIPRKKLFFLRKYQNLNLFMFQLLTGVTGVELDLKNHNSMFFFQMFNNAYKT